MLSSPDRQPLGDEDFRKLLENFAHNSRPIELTGDDQLILDVVAAILGVGKLRKYIYRLEEILKDPKHKLFYVENETYGPEMQEHLGAMRRAQVSALLHAIKVILKCEEKTVRSIPKITEADKNRAIDESLKKIGL